MASLTTLIQWSLFAPAEVQKALKSSYRFRLQSRRRTHTSGPTGKFLDKVKTFSDQKIKYRLSRAVSVPSVFLELLLACFCRRSSSLCKTELWIRPLSSRSQTLRPPIRCGLQARWHSSSLMSSFPSHSSSHRRSSNQTINAPTRNEPKQKQAISLLVNLETSAGTDYGNLLCWKQR